MFEPIRSWSLPEHLWQVSEWSALCTSRRRRRRARTRSSTSGAPRRGCDGRRSARPAKQPIYAWTDLTYLLHRHHVSWGYYVSPGTEPDCEQRRRADLHAGRAARRRPPGIWNPLPYFDTVQRRPPARQHPVDQQLLRRPRDRARCRRSAGWSRPAAVSEHPPAPVSAGQSYVTSLVNAVMRGQDWKLDRDLPGLGRLGRLLRPRAAADGRRQRLRLPGAGHRDQPVRPARVRRPPVAVASTPT